MKKSILNLGNALNKAEQKNIKGGQVFNGPCFEWCADPYIQELYWKPLFCSCNTSGGGGGNPPGGGNDGPTDWV
ncbi:hypothetical protein [Tenacibaculum sp. 190524A05c]|jgi:hypothetical protein|uniref:Natural product n=1 Tax=Tenacibaculum platacis TaxID=3137852 RepID=A0ABP1EPW2_9FLAO